MTTDVLLGFGDSWATGSELGPTEKPYLDLLSDQLGFPCINFAQPSSSIPHLILQFQQFVDTKYFPKHRYHAIFFLTAIERTFLFDLDTREIVHCSPQQRNPIMCGEYYKLHTDELADFNLNTSILALQRLCSLYNINDHYVLGWQSPKLWTSIDTTKFFRQGLLPITALFCNGQYQPITNLLAEKNQYIWPNQGHPNQQGHELIAQALRDMINVH